MSTLVRDLLAFNSFILLIELTSTLTRLYHKMYGLIALAAIVAAVNAQAVTSKISPPGAAPSGCSAVFTDTFAIVALRMDGLKADKA